MTTGKLLGLDYGEKRIGVAISDENARIAFPKIILPNNKDIFSKLKEIIEQEQVQGVVVGESLDFAGMPNKVSSQIEIFFRRLEAEFGLPVHKQKEFLTSVEARKSANTKRNTHISQAHSKIKKAKTKKVDAQAAAIILQRYLDRNSKQTQK